MDDLTKQFASTQLDTVILLECSDAVQWFENIAKYVARNPAVTDECVVGLERCVCCGKGLEGTYYDTVELASWMDPHAFGIVCSVTCYDVVIYAIETTAFG